MAQASFQTLNANFSLKYAMMKNGDEKNVAMLTVYISRNYSKS